MLCKIASPELNNKDANEIDNPENKVIHFLLLKFDFTIRNIAFIQLSYRESGITSPFALAR